MDLTEIALDEVLEELQLPKNSSFLGYTLHIPEEDCFLTDYCDDGQVVRRSWTLNPDNALMFENYSEVLAAKSSIDKKTFLAWFFDTGTEVVVVHDEEE